MIIDPVNVQIMKDMFAYAFCEKNDKRLLKIAVMKYVGVSCNIHLNWFSLINTKVQTKQTTPCSKKTSHFIIRCNSNVPVSKRATFGT